MNIVKLQDHLKDFSQEQLVKEMQTPSGNTPQFLVLGEIMRRKRIQDDSTAQQAKDEGGTVAEEAIAAAGVPQGGIADMARALAPSTDMTQNTGVQAMYAGGFVKKMAEGGGTSTAKRYTPRDKRVLSDAALIAMANRKGMTVSEYLRAMSPKERELVEAQSAARATRDRMQAIEPSTDSVSMVGANPSYQEQLTSVFPPEPEPVRDRPDFEKYGREGAPSMQEQGAAARLPSFADMLTPNFEETGREPEPGFFTDERIRRALAPSMDELVTQNRMASMEGVNAVRPEYPSGYAPATPLAGINAVRPEYPSGYAPATPQLPFAMPDVFVSEGNMVRPEYISGNAPDNMGVVPEPVGMDSSQAIREELAYNVQGGRAGPQTALPPEALREVEKVRAAGGEAFTLPELLADTFGGYGLSLSLDDATAGAAVPGPGRTPVPTEKPAAIDEAITAAAQDKTADTKLEGIAAAKAAADEATVVADKAAADKAAADKAAAAATGGTGGVGGAGGMSSYEQELMNVLQKREKAAEQDKWLALAQVGMNLMSSQQPTLGGALGEAGLKGVEAARGARDQYDKDRLELLGALEQSRMARGAAAAKAAQGGGGLKPLNAGGIMAQQKYMLDLAESQLGSLTGGQSPAQAKAMLTEAAKGGDVMAANQLIELDNAIKQYSGAYNNYMSAAEQLGALTMTEPEADDEIPNLSD